MIVSVKTPNDATCHGGATRESIPVSKVSSEYRDESQRRIVSFPLGNVCFTFTISEGQLGQGNITSCKSFGPAVSVV